VLWNVNDPFLDIGAGQRRRLRLGDHGAEPTPALRREFACGALVQALPERDLESVDFRAVFTNGRAAKTSARAIIAYFADILLRA